MTSLQQYQADIIIDNNTGESFMSQAGLARVCGVAPASIAYFANGKEIEEKTAEVLTTQGLRIIKRYDESFIAKAIRRFNPTIENWLRHEGHLN